MTPAQAYAAMGDFPSGSVLGDDEMAIRIKREVCRAYHIPEDQLLSAGRGQHIAHARMVAMWATRERTSYSFPKIAELYRKANHSTVIHAYNLITRRMAEPQFARTITRLLASVESST